VQQNYIENQSNVRMFEVIFANGVTKYIPSRFPKQILKHEIDFNEQTSMSQHMRFK